MAIVDIQRLVASEDLLVTGGGGQPVAWVPRRLASFEDGGSTYLLAGGDSSNGLGLISFAPSGRLDFQDAFATVYGPLDGYRLSKQGLAVHEAGERDFVYSTGWASDNGGSWRYAVTVLDFSDPASPGVLQHFADPEAIGEVGINGGMDPLVAGAGGRDFLLVTGARGNVFHSYRIFDNGKLGPLKVSQASERLSDGFTSTRIDGTTYIVTFGAWDTAPMQVLKLNKKGFLAPVFELSGDEPAIYNRITKGIVTAEAGGETYVFASEVTRGTIMSYKMDSKGGLTLVDQIAPGTGDFWGAPEGLEAFTHDGETYIVSGGYGRSIAVFKVSDGGSLIEVDEFTMEAPSLGRVADIEVVQFAPDETFFAVSTLSGAPLTSFQFLATWAPITGGARDNRLKGTDEDDEILARNGNDKVLAGLGDDLIEGGAGNDTLLGQGGDDDIHGGGGRDLVRGGSGDEFIFGGAGRDRLKGNDGNDYIAGGGGNDRIAGNDGNDRLFGGAGADRLAGGSGNDRLMDGAGKGDVLSGGSGSDVFILADDGARDRITDFEDGLDRIDLRAEGEMLFTDLEISKAESGLIVRYGDDSLHIEAAGGTLNVHDLSNSDFIFL